MEWKVLESEYLHQEPWLTVRKDKCEMPNGQVVPAFYVNEYPDWVNGFCLTEDNKVILVRQYRHGIRSIETELPGGVSEAGESPGEACRREVMEETGYEFDEFEYLGKVSANPSTTNNFTHFFLARHGRLTAPQKLDESEDLEVVLMTIDEVKQLLRNRSMMQSLHVNCILYALERLGELRY